MAFTITANALVGLKTASAKDCLSIYASNHSLVSAENALQKLAKYFRLNAVYKPLEIEKVYISLPPACYRLEQWQQWFKIHHGIDMTVVKDTLMIQKTNLKVDPDKGVKKQIDPILEELFVSADELKQTFYRETVWGPHRSLSDAPENYSTVELLNEQGVYDLVGALNMISGVKVNNDQFAVIRGLPSRYQSVRLNGASLESLDPNHANIALDIVPLSILNYIDLNKISYADSPGSATAGTVNLNSHYIPETNYLSVFASLGYRADTSWNSGPRTQSYNKHMYASAPAYRRMPDELKQYSQLDIWASTEPGQKRRLAQEIAANYGVYHGRADGDYQMEFKLAQYWPLHNDAQLGGTASFNYTNQWQKKDVKSDKWSLFTNSNGDMQARSIQSAAVTELSNHINISQHLELAYQDEQNYLGANLIFLKNTLNQASNETIRQPSTQLNINNYLDLWLEKQLNFAQVHGRHQTYLASPLSIEWQLTQNRTQYNAPYNNRYSYQSNQLMQPPKLALGKENFLLSWSRMWQNKLSAGTKFSFFNSNDSDENAWRALFGADFSQLLQNGHQYDFTFNYIGEAVPDNLLENPNPSYILSPQHISGGDTDGFVLNPVMPFDLDAFDSQGNRYQAKKDNMALYGQLELTYKNGFSAVAGLRYEKDKQQGRFAEITWPEYHSLHNESMFLPSFSVAQNIDSFWSTAFSYSQKHIWPTINELMPRDFFDNNLGINVRGNPALSSGKSLNYDWSLKYSGSNWQLSQLIFYKDLQNAIEGSFANTFSESAAFDLYTYTNTEQAWVYGFEVEANASKQFLHGDWLDLNIDFAYSRSDAGGRRLQGQPEYLAGVQLFYQPANSRFTLNLNYRLNGSETEIVSPNLLVPDVELAPRAELNLGVRYAANSKLILNANINNLTNDAFKYRQGNELFRQYKLGRTFEFGVHYKFN